MSDDGMHDDDFDDDEEGVFVEAVRSAEDYAGILDQADGSAYFYLFKLNMPEGEGIRAAIHVESGHSTLQEQDFDVRWDDDEEVVGLFICGRLWAAFDMRDQSMYGGDYRAGKVPGVPQRIAQRFGQA